MSTALSPQDEAKRAAGRHAATYAVDGMRVGLGTGSTVRFTIEALAESGLDLMCTSTSVQTHELATSLGLTVVSPDELGALDLVIDGADEVNPALDLTKGGGGAHTREKIVAQMTTRFIVIVDESKLVPQLGPFGIPLEVLDFAPGRGGRPGPSARGRATSRPARGAATTATCCSTRDFGPIADPVALAAELSAVPGLVEHGIFPGSMVERVVVAGTDGVRELTH